MQAGTFSVCCTYDPSLRLPHYDTTLRAIVIGEVAAHTCILKTVNIIDSEENKQMC